MYRCDRLTVLAGVASLWLAGCRHAPEPIAFQNQVFYDADGQLTAGRLSDYEQPYPPLDAPDQPPGFIGVQVLGGTVRLSRPKNWVIRAASNEPARRYIEYLSPSEVIFTVYERVESPIEPWSVVMGRYEKELEKAGGSLKSKAFPVATWNAQGRGYLVERGVPAPKEPFRNTSREYLLRGKHRIVLVQIVHQGKTVQHIEDEVLRPFSTLQLL